jgi:hypothetical protein
MFKVILNDKSLCNLAVLLLLMFILGFWMLVLCGLMGGCRHFGMKTLRGKLERQFALCSSLRQHEKELQPTFVTQHTCKN